MKREEMIEAMARAVCVSGGFDPNDIMPNDGRRWRYYVPGAEAALSAIEQAGMVVVPLDPNAEMTGDAVRHALSAEIGSEYPWPQYMTDLYRIMIESGRLK